MNKGDEEYEYEDDKIYLVLKVKIFKEVKRSDGLHVTFRLWQCFCFVLQIYKFLAKLGPFWSQIK